MPRDGKGGAIALGLLGAVAVTLVTAAGADPLVTAIRFVSIRLTAPRILVALIAVGVAVSAARWAGRRFRGARPGLVRLAGLRHRASASRWSSALPPAVLGAIVGVVAVLRIEASKSRSLPHILSDELIYTYLGRGLANGTGLTVRGMESAGYGVAYPLLIAPAFAFAGNGARAFEIVQALNAVLLATAAVPAYLLARRVLPVGVSLAAAGLTVLVPEMGYAAVVMTEALFYPLFLWFALALVRVVESPTIARQLTCLALLGVLCTVRAQAFVLVAAVAITIPLAAGAGRRTELVRRLTPTWIVFGVAAVAVLLATGGDPAAALGAYRVLLTDSGVLDIPTWAAKNLAALALGLGIVALAIFPIAAFDLVRRTSSTERAVGAVAVSTTLTLLASVAVLSASPYGLGRLHERNLFYLIPLIVITALTWFPPSARRGLRPAVLVGVAVVIVALPLALTDHDYEISDALGYDVPSLGRWDDLGTAFLPARFAVAIVAALATAVAFRARSRWVLLVTLVLAFVSMSTRIDRTSVLDRADVRELAWVDDAISDKEPARLVYVGLPSTRCDHDGRLASLSLWTEFFNTSIREASHVGTDNPAAGLASPRMTISPDGRLLLDGHAVSGGYTVLDGRISVVGTRLAELRWNGVPGGFGHGSPGLALWNAESPLRVRDPDTLRRLRRSPVCNQGTGSAGATG